MKKLYEKSELAFAIVLIVIYSAGITVAERLSDLIGITSIVTAVFLPALSAFLLIWVGKRGLFDKYGLCGMRGSLTGVLFFLPLAVIATRNFWNGFAVNLPVADTVFYIIGMLSVGFLEEILFRGFLFKAIEKENVKIAFAISALTFGLGHIFHLFDGSGMMLVANLCQVFGAIGVGFLFQAVFYTTGSLIPCIITHGLYDAFSAFANEVGLSDGFRIVTSGITVGIAVLYGVYLLAVRGGKSKRVIRTERLLLRPLSVADVDDVYEWVSDPEVNRFVLYPLYTNKENLRVWLASIKEEDNEFAFVLRRTGKVIGSGAIVYQEESKAYVIGYNFNRKYWGSGYATEATKGMMEWAKKTFDAKDFEAVVASENTRSRNVIQKCGLTFSHNTTITKIDGSAVYAALCFTLHLDSPQS